MDNNFFLKGEETYGNGSEVHTIRNIKKIYSNNSVSFFFTEKDWILGISAVIVTICDFYIEIAKVLKINGVTYEISGEVLMSDEKTFFFFEKKIEKCGKNIVIKFDFLDEESYNYSKQILVYTIDGDHLDNYYRDIEYSNWK